MNGNLLDGLPTNLAREDSKTLLEAANLRLVRIVSTGQATPEGQWYDQDENEWVMVVTGKARIGFEDGEPERVLGPGDYVCIPAHRRHRVEWTDPDETTVWLALHYG